jgi:hypothetical protein
MPIRLCFSDSCCGADSSADAQLRAKLIVDMELRNPNGLPLLPRVADILHTLTKRRILMGYDMSSVDGDQSCSKLREHAPLGHTLRNTLAY